MAVIASGYQGICLCLNYGITVVSAVVDRVGFVYDNMSEVVTTTE